MHILCRWNVCLLIVLVLSNVTPSNAWAKKKKKQRGSARIERSVAPAPPAIQPAPYAPVERFNAQPAPPVEVPAASSAPAQQPDIPLVSPTPPPAAEAVPPVAAPSPAPAPSSALPATVVEAPPEVHRDRQPDSGVFPIAVGAMIGATFPQLMSKLGTSVSANVEVSYFLPWLSQRLALVASAGYMQPEYSGVISDPRLAGQSASYSVIERELLITLGAAFRAFAPQSPLNFYGKLGGVMHLQRAYASGDAAAAGFGTNQETATKAGFLATLGGELALGPGSITAEANLELSGLSHVVTGPANGGGISLLAGYRFYF